MSSLHFNCSPMKHTMFFLIWMTVLSLLFILVGVMALLGYQSAEIVFWTDSALGSKSGKVAWISLSTVSLTLFLVLAIREHRNKKE
ncbi:MAG: hypothetical protein KZQ91_06655 [Candidatus Thiodiazotropha sp. (ex Lucinoma borealis)]|nr:hypothetical protein [Candidatus Thiodiazotropha sp. (ex Lucinoma borealis)]